MVVSIYTVLFMLADYLFAPPATMQKTLSHASDPTAHSLRLQRRPKPFDYNHVLAEVDGDVPDNFFFISVL